MSEDNVVMLGSRRPMSEEKKMIEEAEARHQETVSESQKDHRQAMLTVLDNLKERVEAGELESLVAAGRNPGNGAFISVVLMNALDTRVDTYLAHAGILDAMKLDCVDLANAGPHMNSDGSYFAFGQVSDPFDEEDEE